MKRIYFTGDDDQTCEVGPDILPGFDGECDEPAPYTIEEHPTSGPVWSVCAKHKDEIKDKGIAE